MADDDAYDADQLGIGVRDLLEVAPDAMLVLDDRGVIRRVNGAAEHLFGWPRDELVGQLVEVLVPERLRKRHAVSRGHADQAPIRRPMHARVGLVALRRDGSEFAAEIGLSPVATRSGLATIASIRDISERVRLEASLREADRQRADQMALIASVMEILARRDTSPAGLHSVLEATIRGAGVSRGALLRGSERLTVAAAVGFDDAVLAALGESSGAWLAELARGVPAATWTAGHARPEVDRLLAALGLSSLQVVPLSVDGASSGLLLLGAVGDESPSADATVFARAVAHQLAQAMELDRAFGALAASELRYRTLMDRASDAIAVLTTDGRIREANRRAGEVFGVPPEDLVGRSAEDLAVPGADGSVPAWSIAAAGARPSGPAVVHRPDGGTSLVEFTLQAVDVSGERLFVATGRDVTEQVRAREHLMIADRMASIGTLAAGVAHEINNPLTAVVANLEMAQADLAPLLDGPDRDTLVEVAAMQSDAAEAAQRVREIVRDLKLFSRAADDHVQVVDVHRVLDSSLRMARNEIRHTARLVKDYGAVPRVRGNESRLGQVFLNLLVNAAQAIPEGMADQNEIRVATRRDDRGRVVVEVSDTGVGMSADTLRRVFSPFFTTKAPGVGTGLGLAIVQRIVTEVGGEVTVTSAPGSGTRFEVHLPIAEGAESPRSHPPREMPPPRRGRLLVVDDEAALGTAMRRALGRDHDVEVVTEAEVALRRIASGESFDFVVCDLMMPVMTGMDLYEALLDKAPHYARSMVFVTGGVFTPRARAFLDQVPNPRLEKPFDLQALRALVHSRLS